MTVYLAGMRATADRMNDHSLEDSTTSGLVAGTDWTVNSFSGRKVNGITTVHIYLQYTGTTVAIAYNTNLSDRTIATLPDGWRPPEVINALAGDGQTMGEVTIGTTGLVSLRAMAGDLTNGRNFRITAEWISENG
ncbi:hypothetical protein [Streptomyces sp. CC219B]|uniref:hypothetical protein n=1 Tax=Streptomyces sp. CC219B TaxID=3044574 RepID=UPI0024A8B8A8|nr:hypothetical protein [Streptomyces sp. CC219B]